MGRNLRIYWPFALNQIKSNFAYRGSFYLGILRKFFGMFIYYYLWMAIYASTTSGELGGFSRSEMILYVFMSYTISDIIMVGISSDIGRDVIDGNVAMNLIKPINYRMSLIFRSFGIMIYRLVVPSLFIWVALEVYKVVKLGMDIVSPVRILAFLISMFLSFLVYVFFDYCFGLLAFVTTYIFGMQIIKNAVLNFLTGKLIPISFFPIIFQRVFSFLPFTAMTYVPVMIYLGKYSNEEILFELAKQLVWVILLCGLGSFLWKKVEKRLVILGG
ncbi:MAG: ABC-2 family transporter protein [Lachnospiraceae bacterium]|nr:ABC-2 family transporter protein [Lachnospiraceae bacterium]